MPLLTEAEAKEKWCPQSESERCLASGCMCWRWGETPHYADHGRRFADIKENPAYLNAKLERSTEDEFDELLDSLTKKYTENPLPRPDDIPDSWEYLVSFEEWYEEGCVMWLESAETAKPRAEAKRRGYCGLAGKPEE